MRDKSPNSRWTGLSGVLTGLDGPSLAGCGTLSRELVRSDDASGPVR